MPKYGENIKGEKRTPLDFSGLPHDVRNFPYCFSYLINHPCTLWILISNNIESHCHGETMFVLFSLPPSLSVPTSFCSSSFADRSSWNEYLFCALAIGVMRSHMKSIFMNKAFNSRSDGDETNIEIPTDTMLDNSSKLWAI